jgi:hypothetical protein
MRMSLFLLALISCSPPKDGVAIYVPEYDAKGFSCEVNPADPVRQEREGTTEEIVISETCLLLCGATETYKSGECRKCLAPLRKLVASRCCMSGKAVGWSTAKTLRDSSGVGAGEFPICAAR